MDVTRRAGRVGVKEVLMTKSFVHQQACCSLSASLPLPTGASPCSLWHKSKFYDLAFLASRDPYMGFSRSGALASLCDLNWTLQGFLPDTPGCSCPRLVGVPRHTHGFFPDFTHAVPSSRNACPPSVWKFSCPLCLPKALHKRHILPAHCVNLESITSFSQLPQHPPIISTTGLCHSS